MLPSAAHRPWFPTTLALTLTLGLAGLPAAHASGRHKGGKAKARTTAASKVQVGAGGGSAASALESKAAAAGPETGSTLATTRTVMSRKVHPGANLAGAHLSFANLSRMDLRGVDFRGADLTGTLFIGSDLTGARLEGARVVAAVFLGATGVDLAGAETHPFFEGADRDPVGVLRLFAPQFDHGPRGTARHLFQAPDGHVVWSVDQEGGFQSLSPTGMVVGFNPGNDTRAFGLARDTENHLWFFGDNSTGRLDLEAYLRTRHDGEFPYTELPALMDRPALAILPLRSQDYPVFFFDQGPQTRTFHYRDRQVLSPPAKQVRDVDYLALAKDLTDTRLAMVFPPARDNPDGPAGVVLMTLKTSSEPQVLNLPEGLVPRRAAFTADGRIWLTCEGRKGRPDALVYTDPAAKDPRCEVVECKDGALADPFGLIAGPDGDLWFTQRGPGRISRLSGKGELQSWDLPRGVRPLELFPGQAGRLFYSIEGRDWLGSVQAQAQTKARTGDEAKAPEGDATGDAKATGFETERYKPRPEPAKALTRKQRWARHEARLERARQLHLAALAERLAGPGPAPAGAPAEAAETGAGAAESKAAAVETKAEGAGPAAPADTRQPWEILDELRVAVPKESLEHIDRWHCRTAHAAKSRFAAAYRTPEAMEKLLAHGLLRAGEIGREIATRGAGRGLGFLTDAHGVFLTRCPWPGVGAVRNGDGQTVTGTFTVATRRQRNPDDGGWEHVVISAYPDWD
jgi:hypothetical protein